ncbi:MAG: hypothetical protein ACLFUJ_13135 [Phycisphaerae bacterium]
MSETTPQNPPPEASDQAEQSPAPTGPVSCPATRDTAVRMFIGAAICLGFSIWCFIDWANYPKPDAPLSVETLNGYAGWAFNHFLPFILIPISIVLIALAIRSQKLVLVADEQGIGYQGKEKISWESIQQLDATKLADKQIMDIHHPGGRLRLDGLKLQNFRQLVSYVELKIPAEKQTIE